MKNENRNWVRILIIAVILIACCCIALTAIYLASILFLSPDIGTVFSSIIDELATPTP